MNEPRWRTALCWGAVITFLTMPLVMFVLITVSIEVPWLHTNEHLKDFGGLRIYFQTLTALVFSLAGLHSWDKTIDRKFNGGPKDGNGGNHVAPKSDERPVKPN